jgi:hypothetical protein
MEIARATAAKKADTGRTILIIIKILLGPSISITV